MAQAKIAPVKLEDIKGIFFVRRQLNRQFVVERWDEPSFRSKIR